MDKTNLIDYAHDNETLRAAAERAIAQGLILGKYADPTEEAREGLTADEAVKVASEDASLVYVLDDPDTWAQNFDRRNPTPKHTCGPNVCRPGCPVYETESDEVRAQLDRTRAGRVHREALIVGDGVRS